MQGADDDAFKASEVKEKVHYNNEKVPFGGIGVELQKSQKEKISV
jgi:hypothetical protein